MQVSTRHTNVAVVHRRSTSARESVTNAGSQAHETPTLASSSGGSCMFMSLQRARSLVGGVFWASAGACFCRV